MKENKRIQAVLKLGSYLRTNFCSNDGETVDVALTEVMRKAEGSNSWFTSIELTHSLKSWGELLTEKQLFEWLASYNLSIVHPKKILLILAGNIPLVGFHDLLVCYISGHNTLVKLSSSDAHLLPFMVNKLNEFNPEDNNTVEFTDELVTEYDAVIATGSDNSARYFEHYFSKKPNIIRKNRNSVAVICGDETAEELHALGEDIFRYFGLGCRSVSKIYVPKGYDFDLLFKAVFSYRELINFEKYSNNYDYNKAVYLMSEFKILDNGFLILKEDSSLSSPIGSLFYEFYDSNEQLLQELNSRKEEIQCVVAKDFLPSEVGFGQTQKPGLSDYADDIDTLKFVLSL